MDLLRWWLLVACTTSVPIMRNLGRQAARMAIRIMKGEKPGKVVKETPEKLELHTNKEMAKELELDITR